MKYLFSILLASFSTSVLADAAVYKLDITYGKLFNNKDPMLPDIPNENWGEAVTIESGVRFWRGYLDLMPHFETAYSKVISVGLKYSLGWQATCYLSVEYEHWSRHSADRRNSYAVTSTDTVTGYPLKDSVSIRISAVPDARKCK